MNLILPFQSQDTIELPKVIFENTEIELSIIEFNLSDKKRFLGVKNILFDKESGEINSWEYQSKVLNKHDLEKLYVIKSKYCFKLFSKNNNSDLPINSSDLKHIEILNLICSVLFNHSFNLIFKYKDDSSFTCPHFSTTYKTNLVDLKLTDKITELFGVLIKNKGNQNQEKVNLISSILITMHIKNIPESLFGALGVTILESVFSTKDEKSEIRYRFPLRMTKYLEGDYDSMFKKIRKLYDKRSSYYHTGKQAFEKGDIIEIKKYLKHILFDFITKTENFDGKEMDKLLLK